MRANFIQRALAYLLDFLVITIILTLIYSAIPDTEKYKTTNERLTEVMSEGFSGTISANEYLNEVSKLSPIVDKERPIHKGVDIVITFAYFCVCAFYNNGQTLGKKIMKIRVKQTSGKLRFSSMTIRTLLTQGGLSGVISLCMIFVLSDSNYFNFSGYIYTITSIFVLICIIMILYTSNKRGLHDIIAKTEVVKEKGD